MIENIDEVRKALIQLFEEFKEGKIKPAEMAEFNNSVGKIISTCKIELEYFSLKKEKPIINFLDYKK